MAQSIGIIGFGSIGQKHLQSARASSPDASCLILSGHASASEIEEAGGVKVNSIDELVAAAPAYVMVSSAASQHDLYLSDLLALDTSIMIEKPVAASVRQGQAMMASASESNSAVVVAYNIRFSKALNSVKDVLAKGTLGTVLSANVVVGQNLEHWRPGRDIEQTVSASRHQGGGVLRELSHELDYLNVLFGQPDRVIGMTGALHYHDLDVEDTALAVLRYGSADKPILVSLTMDFVRQNTTRYCDIVGSDQSLKWDLITGTVKLFGRDGQEEVIHKDIDDLSATRQRMWNSFCNNDRSAFCNLETACNHLKVIETLEASQPMLDELGRIG